MEHVTIVQHKDGSVTLMPDIGYKLMNTATKTSHSIARCKEEEIQKYSVCLDKAAE